MREHPILFSAPMVRAILEGRKTQTRRVVKPQPSAGVRASPFVTSGLEDGHGRELRCPYGQPGDRLWVRERFAVDTKGADALVGQHYETPWYYADADEYGLLGHDGLGPIYVEALRWRPSIHMHRDQSRITLEVTGVRVDRLQDISDEDAAAEGIDYQPNGGELYRPWRGHERWWERPRPAFRDLWDHINGPESWGANPWVWVVEFKRVAE